MMTQTKFFLFFAILFTSATLLAQGSTNYAQPNTNYAQPNKLPKIRAEIDFGLGRILTKTETTNPIQKSYEDNLKKGTCIDASVVYFPRRTFGIGFKFGKFMCQNSISGVTVTYADSTTKTGTLSDNISLNFYGPNLMWRFPSKVNGNVFVVSYAIGLVQYVNHAVLISPFLIEGSTMGTCLNVGYDISIGPNLAIGLNASLWGGVLTSLDVTENGKTEKVNLLENQRIGLGRITGVVGLKYSL